MVDLGLILLGQDLIIVILSNVNRPCQLYNIFAGEEFKLRHVRQVFEDLFIHDNTKNESNELWIHIFYDFSRSVLPSLYIDLNPGQIDDMLKN